MGTILDRDFYKRDDVVQISKDLIGKKLCTIIDGVKTSGIITETEAYNGRNDRACHAFPNVRTNRTEIMYGDPGYAYVYLCYGIHHLFNIVTNEAEYADAVLIRSIQPTEGIDIMMQRRKFNDLKNTLTNGPGKLSKALGITTSDNGADMCRNRIWIEDTMKYNIEIEADTRIGVDYAGDDALLPWRFTMKGSTWLSR